MPDLMNSESRIPREIRDAWLAELRGIGGTNPLKNFEVNTAGQIDLERAHPGGLAQFVTGRPTQLTNLVRDALAYSRAAKAAKRIKAKAERLSANLGLETLFVAAGVANFEADGFDLNVPVLLWPITMTTRGDDFELLLSGEPSVNPILIESLETCYGLKVRAAEILALLQQGQDLLPLNVLEFLASKTAESSKLDLKRTVVIGNFSTIAFELERDIAHASSELLNVFATGLAPAGNGAAAGAPTPEVILVADANATQTRIVERVLAGESFAVETLPGCGYTQTVVNVLANLARTGKRALIVAPRRQTLNELADRLALIGLPGLAIRSHSAWLDIIAAISRNEKATANSPLETLKQSHKKVSADLEDYFSRLNHTDAALGVSVADLFKRLAILSAMPHPPTTRARIAPDRLVALRDKAEALELLHQAEALGEFKFGPQDSAWFQATFDSPAEVEAAEALAKTMSTETFPALRAKMREFTTSVNFKPVETAEEFGLYLRLFIGVRDTLDRFVSDVFDRPLNELILATAPRQQKSQMSGGNRRRLKKLAKEYLRPGVSVTDIHAALKGIQEQRDAWQRYCLVPTAPSVPTGINDAQVAYQSFIANLAELEKHLDADTLGKPLAVLPLDELDAKLRSLAEDTEVLAGLGDRSLVMAQIREAGLGSLARDLARLHTSRDHIAAELDLAWAQSAFELLVAQDGQLLGFSSGALADLEKQFATIDAELVFAGTRALAANLASNWKAAIESEATATATFKALLKSRAATLATAARAGGAVWATLAPAVMASPFEIANVLDANDKFDIALILDAAGTTVAENLSALSRVSQVVTFGDDAIASAVGFELEAGLEPATEIVRPSIFAESSKIFGSEVLRNSYRTSGQTLGQFINREFYQNRIIFEPTAAEFFGKSNFKSEHLTKNTKAKTAAEGVFESPDVEVEHVVELILNHALWHPEESLLVATASALHADRVSEALHIGLKAKPHLAEFFDSHGRERFEVSPIGELAHRIADRVIFSIGFGKDSNGNVPANLGQISEPDGRQHLANLLVSARKEIHVVACFKADEIPASSLTSGAQYLTVLLDGGTIQEQVETEFDRDPMLVDLSGRLQKLGARVIAGFGERLPLVVAFANNVAVIEPDWALIGDTWTEKLRLRPNLLRAMGYKFERVYSFELFADPQAVAHRIAESLGVQVAKRPQPLFDVAETAFEDTDLAWGDRSDSNDRDLRENKPPHWG